MIKRAREWWMHKIQSVEALVTQDKCPKCRGELDVGWECNDCGYDAIAHQTKGKTK
jgi:hypothetical protein